MNKFSILLTATLVLSASAVAVAQENNTSTNNSNKITGQQAIVNLDLLGKTGYLVYTEEYYAKDGSGNLKLDNSRTFSIGNVNKSKVRLKLTRPLDKSGKPYPQSMIKAIASLDNDTVLESWYKDKPKNSTGTDTDNNNAPSTGTKIIPGFDVYAYLIAIGLISAVYLRRRR